MSKLFCYIKKYISLKMIERIRNKRLRGPLVENRIQDPLVLNRIKYQLYRTLFPECWADHLGEIDLVVPKYTLWLKHRNKVNNSLWRWIGWNSMTSLLIKQNFRFESCEWRRLTLRELYPLDGLNWNSQVCLTSGHDQFRKRKR